MALTPDELAQAQRLETGYNERPADPATNALGFARGGNRNVLAALRDFVGLGRGVVRVATETLASIKTQADRFSAALDAMQSGPVLTVNNQTGHVVFDASSIEGAVNERLDAMDAKIADAKAAAFTRAVAFGAY